MSCNWDSEYLYSPKDWLHWFIFVFTVKLSLPFFCQLMLIAVSRYRRWFRWVGSNRDLFNLKFRIAPAPIDIDSLHYCEKINKNPKLVFKVNCMIACTVVNSWQDVRNFCFLECATACFYSVTNANINLRARYKVAQAVGEAFMLTAAWNFRW